MAVNSGELTKNALVNYSSGKLEREKWKQKRVREERRDYPDHFKRYGFHNKFKKFWSVYWTDVEKKFEEMADEVKGDELWNHTVQFQKECKNNINWLSKNIMKCLQRYDDFNYEMVTVTKRKLNGLTAIISTIRIYGRYTVEMKKTDQEKFDEIDRVAKLELMFKVPQEMLSNLVRYYEYIHEDYREMMKWGEDNYKFFKDCHEGYLNWKSSLKLEDVTKFCDENPTSKLCLQNIDELRDDINAYWALLMEEELKLKDNQIFWIFKHWSEPEFMWDYTLNNRDEFFTLRRSLTSDLNTLNEEVTKIQAKMIDDVMSSEEKKLWEDKRRFCQHRLEQYLKMNQHLSYSTLFVSNLDYLINRQSLTYFPFHESGCTAAEMEYSVFPPDVGTSRFQLPHSYNMFEGYHKEEEAWK
eukprot:GHVL01035849.1.p1 GENE.GHVL01035849.1~~GHVL01035849.1.p1  ORF type:complete len:412 (+),score=68.88 GHVL01035849.1:330-1565(+)